MIARLRPSLGLLGQILAILLLTVVIEFGASTLLYERAGRFSVREDEARRLAEHLVIARKLISERPWRERGGLAQELSTERYEVRWASTSIVPPRIAPELDRLRGQIVAWEPSLADPAARLRLISPGPRSAIVGELRLADGSWMKFAMRGIKHGLDLAIGRIALALVPAIGLLALGAIAIRNLLHPLRELAQATERIGLDGETVLPEGGAVEIRRLIRAFNAMQGRIHRLIEDRTQSLAAVGHDIRTPLARLQLRLDAIAARDVREAIAADVAEMEAMVASLLAFLGGEDDPEPAGPSDVAVTAATLVDDAEDRGATATYSGPRHLVATIRPVGIRRALGNLIENAIHYGGRADVSVAAAEGAVVIAVEDDGPGIAEDKLLDVLEPFRRLDGARARNTEGLGLGLAIAVRAVEREGGALRLSNRPEGGLRAEIRLPTAAG